MVTFKELLKKARQERDLFKRKQQEREIKKLKVLKSAVAEAQIKRQRINERARLENQLKELRGESNLSKTAKFLKKAFNELEKANNPKRRSKKRRKK